MPVDRPPEKIDDRDYEAIEAAVMETARGRWFLAEHARRIREAESSKVLRAIGHLAEMMCLQGKSAAPAAPADDERRFADMAARIEERLLDLSWLLRGRGVEDAVCELLDREARRLRRMALGEAELDEPEPLILPEVATPQEAMPPEAPVVEAAVAVTPPVEIEAIVATETFVTATEEPAELMAVAVDSQPNPVEEHVPLLRPSALAWIDELPFREKLKLFA